jgi:hypothetical protein
VGGNSACFYVNDKRTVQYKRDLYAYGSTYLKGGDR